MTNKPLHKPTLIDPTGSQLARRAEKYGLSIAVIGIATDLAHSEIEAAFQERVPVPFRLRVFVTAFGTSHPSAKNAILRAIHAGLHLSEPEEWRPIPGYPRYEASSLGRIRRAADENGRPVGYVLKPTPSDSGHLKVSIYGDTGKKQKRAGVHQIVCLTFHGPAPEGKPIALHGDGVPTNNRPENLRWGTHTENAKDMLKHAREKVCATSAQEKRRRGWRVFRKRQQRLKVAS